MASGVLAPNMRAESRASGTPARITWLTAIFVAIIAGVSPLDLIASLANAGTLCAFVAVAACVLVMRRRGVVAEGFRTPAAWLVAPAAILGCCYLFTSLQVVTQVSFLAWNAVGLAVYFLYGRRRAIIG